MNAYVLEDKVEAERLERQAKRAAYDFSEDFGSIDLSSVRLAVDAGCGSGVVSREIARRCPRARVVGVDGSPARVVQARELASGISNLTFSQQNLMNLEFASGSVDLIYCRYVLEHMSNIEAEKVVAELARVLRPGGTAVLVDVDGFFYTAHPQGPNTRELFANLRAFDGVDFEVGRKLEGFGLKAGLESIQTQIKTFNFRGSDLGEEIEMLSERLDQAKSFLSTLCKQADGFSRFKEEFISNLKLPGATLFYNKFVTHVRKPAPRRGRA